MVNSWQARLCLIKIAKKKKKQNKTKKKKQERSILGHILNALRTSMYQILSLKGRKSISISTKLFSEVISVIALEKKKKH